MWLFLAQYKKMIALCAIPIIAVVAFIGFEVIHGQENRSEPLAVNKEMKALLEQNVKQTVTPAPTVTAVPEASVLPERTTKPKAASKPRVTARPKQTQSPDFKININKAMTEELVKLPGIGESKAKAIITYRDAHPFQTLDELMKVKGIGPKIFEKIKEHVEL